ncbi:Protein of unknown function [Saccharopolyspora antimicrobica]|uniref:Uncharacterized protein DUF3558 n=1 Tax=Saccharopolyspora antimicrobica TaxID=455193 RepID=A0A1I5BIK2_9PSEU|nr:DUF3558 domain-containing protein [Saccharopolyspora antimicrobica]RKT86623.1 uncharacterized protein DUF3558 [Saccharopolyspora antimicrobica]SFN74553.1 Protein of unknown function [Saccharopolyspora antimicrobica]
MREGLAAGVIVAGLLLAGCSSGATPADQPDAPGRSAPQKTLPTSDPCAVLTEEQLKTLVLDQEPKQAEQNGKQGCEFRSGAPGAPGWSVFVAADPTGTYQQFVQANQGAQELPIAGYPSAIVNDETGCHLTMDVTDAGSLKLTALVGPGAPLEVGGSCDAAAKVAESVLQNLPSA